MPKYGSRDAKKLEKRLLQVKRTKLIEFINAQIYDDDTYYALAWAMNEIYDIAYANGFDDGLAGSDLLPGMDYDDF